MSVSKFINGQRVIVAGGSGGAVSSLGIRASYDESPALYEHAVNDIIYYNNHFYKVTSAVDVGDTLTEGTNITSTTGIVVNTAIYVDNIPDNGGGTPIVPNKSWGEATDEELVQILAAADAGTIDLADDLGWKVGDERVVHLNAMNAMSPLTDTHSAQDVTFVLMHKGLYRDTNDKEVNFVVGMKNCLAEDGIMGSTPYANSADDSWKGCSRRAWCNSVFKNAIPSTLVSIFKQFKTVTAGVYNGSTNQVVSDYFAIASAKEIFGQQFISNATEASALTQFTYYSTVSNQIKTNGTNAVNYFTRSPQATDKNGVVGVKYDGSYIAPNAYFTTVYLSMFGCI